MPPALTVDWLRPALTEVAEPERAGPMAAYMKDRFPFLGVTTPRRREAQKPLLPLATTAPVTELLDFASRCWAEPEREFQYVAVDLLRKAAGRLGPEHVEPIEALIRAKSWWDTVDGLAAWVVGPMVAAHSHLAAVMDDWIEDENPWIARTALLHQLSFKEDTDAERLFGYVHTRSGDTDFFLRKAAGWALRQYARTDPDAVRAFVADNGDVLSPLTKREATKHL